MLKKPIKYTNLNGDEVTETFYFGLSEPELMEMEAENAEGLSAMIERIVNLKDSRALLAEFKRLILMSYGVKSDDGRRFIKNEEVRADFEQCPAYGQLYLELFDPDKLNKFIEDILPAGLAEKLRELNSTLPNRTQTPGSMLPPPPRIG